MEALSREFIKCECEFFFTDGDAMLGERKIVPTRNVGDYVERQARLYKGRYGSQIFKAKVRLFSWRHVPHKRWPFMGVCRDKLVKSYEIKV